jgi:hypothetical protein
MLYLAYTQIFKLSRYIQDVFCPMKKYKKFKNTNYPWLWIGAVCGENNIQSVTELINDEVYPGCHVDYKFLESATGLTPTSWLYLDSTLNEIEFPKEGITIAEDDPIQ